MPSLNTHLETDINGQDVTKTYSHDWNAIQRKSDQCDLWRIIRFSELKRKEIMLKKKGFFFSLFFFFSSLVYRRIDEYTYTQKFINALEKKNSILSGCKYQPIPMISFLISGPILLFLPSSNGNRRPSVRFSSLLGNLLPWNLHSDLDVSLIFHKFLFNEMSKSFKNIFLDNQTRLLDFWGLISYLLTRVICADILKSLKKRKEKKNSQNRELASLRGRINIIT